MLKPGLMMDRPLLLSGILEHAASQFGSQEVVSRETHGPLFRYTYADCAKRSRQLANALHGLNLKQGSVVGSIAWNNHRHLEAYYAVSGSGMVMHTCNPRLHPQQLIYIINHAEDEVVLFDITFAPLVKGIAAHCPKVRAWVCLTERAHMPEIEGVANVLCYDELIAFASDVFVWPDFDERSAAAICYTSGTTGNPKGAMYSHRAIVINALSGCLPSILNLSPEEAILPVVPMFHINAWCIPYAAPIGGAKLVLPGPKLDGASLYELIEAEKVTISAGVPTIWMALIQHLEQNKLRFSTMRRTAVGGSAMPTALIAKFSDDYDVEVRHGWGMTETTAVATMSSMTLEQRAMPAADRHTLVGKQGRSVFGVEIKVVDEEGNTLPRDGASQGELMVRGQWIISGYYKGEKSPLVDGWFASGDIATIDADRYVFIVDRSKDMIISGGENIYSVQVEEAISRHEAVLECAVIGIPDEEWGESVKAFVVLKPGMTATEEEIITTAKANLASYQKPRSVEFIDALPKAVTGKILKRELRDQYWKVNERQV